MAPAPPRPFASMFSAAALSSSMQDMLLHAACDGDLRLFKRLVRALDRGRGRLREAVEAARTDGGHSALHLAAGSEQLEVCRYLVEALRVDVNVVDDEGRTPLVYAVLSENAAVVKYLLDHAADPNKADNDGLTPLHSAAGIGDCEMVEMLLAKGAYVDPLADECGTPLHIAAKERQAGDCEMVEMLLAKGAYVDPLADECGTPLHIAAKERQAGTMKCNKTFMIYGLYGMTPLFQAINVSSVKCVKLLIEAGADVSSDCVLTALNDSNLGNEGSTECLNFLLDTIASSNVPNDDYVKKRKIALKSLGNKAVEKEDYFSASSFYNKAMDLDPDDATLFSNRSLCWLRMCDGQKALLDSLACKEMQPDWPKACYRQGAALMLLNDYKSACEAFFDGFMLDPENTEIENALRQAMESLKVSKGTKVK